MAKGSKHFKSQNNPPPRNDAKGSAKPTSTKPVDALKQNWTPEIIQSAEKEIRMFIEYEKVWKIENEPEETKFLYLLSKKSIFEWKKYICFDDYVAKKPLTGPGGPKPRDINEDLIVFTDKTSLQYQDPDSSYLNLIMRKDVHVNKDFYIVPENIWNIFKFYTNSFELKREVIYDEKGNRIVDIFPLEMRLCVLYFDFLRKMDNDPKLQLPIRKLLVSPRREIKSLKESLCKIIHKMPFAKFRIQMDGLRIWRKTREKTDEEFKKFIYDALQASKTYDYQIEFPGDFLEANPYATIHETGLDDEDLVVIEYQEPSKNFVFFNDNIKVMVRCDFCRVLGNWEIKCICNNVNYCSEDCKLKDRKFHGAKCDKAWDSDEEKEVEVTETSVKGLCGLVNLGNTCYMNSALQCLSNTPFIVKYLLSNEYKKDINKDNPLGSGGKIAKKYAYIVKSLWNGVKEDYSPFSFKHAFEKIYTMFAGENQHDASEFLGYLLDIIHEDVNRVKDKPYVEMPEGEGKKFHEYAIECWDAYLRRNNSILTDNFFGQFKSQITCPKCKHTSVTFDSFSICSLPIPNQTQLEVFFGLSDNIVKPTRMLVKYDEKVDKLGDIRTRVAEMTQVHPDSLYGFIASKTSVQILENLAQPVSALVKELTKNPGTCLFFYKTSESDANIYEDTFYLGELRFFKKINDQKDPYRQLGLARPIYIHKEWTLYDLHIAIFKRIRPLIEPGYPFRTKYPVEELSDKEFFHEVANRYGKKPFYRVDLLTNSNEKANCYFCDKRNCGNCELENRKDMRVSDLLHYIKDPKFVLTFQIYFVTTPDYAFIDALKEFLHYKPPPKKEEKKELQNGPTQTNKDKEQKDVNGKNGPVEESKVPNEEKKDGEKSQEPPKETKDTPVIALESCLEYFSEPEKLEDDNEWYCRICKEHQKATKQLNIFTLPNTLIFHLKRFKTAANQSRWTRSESKISDLIKFPLTGLDLSKVALNAVSPKELKEQGADAKTEAKYNLYAVINHYGTLNSGHYTAFAKNHITGKWYLYDDSKVSEAEEQEVVSNAAYLLFYQRQ